MANFFEKLKRGMGIEEPVEEKKIEERPKVKKDYHPPTTLPAKGGVPRQTRVKIEEGEKVEFEIKKIEKVEKPEIREEVKKEEAEKPSEEKFKEKWLEQEGQLAVDIYQTESDLVIQSAIAGVRPEDLDISIEKDILTIGGERRKPFEESGDYFSQECYWGHFSRQIILPVEIDPDKTEATLKEGILTIRMPKILREKKRRIIVKG